MPVTPFGVEVGILYRLTGPDGTSVSFNDSAQWDFVGFTEEVTGLDGPDTRESADLIVEGDGGYHGNFYHGRRPIVLSGIIDPNTFGSARNTMVSNLLRATNAMRQDAVLSWTPTGGDPVAVRVRRQQPPRVTGGRVKSFQVALVAADPRVYGTAERTLARTSETSPSGWYGHAGDGGDYDAAALFLGTRQHWSLGAAGLTDLSGNGWNGVAAGGLATGGYSPGPLLRGDNTATNFDGTDDRFSVPYPTRRNLVLNPRFAVNTSTWGPTTSPWTGDGGTVNSSGRVTVGDKTAYEFNLTKSGTSTQVYVDLRNAAGNIPVVPGEVFTAVNDIEVVESGAGTYANVLLWYNSTTFLSATSGTATAAGLAAGNYQISVTGTAPASATSVVVAPRYSSTTPGDTAQFRFTNFIVEKAAAAGGGYFDGSGYVNSEGDWVDDAGGRCGWLGTAHASASEIGTFANGTARTFSFWLRRDSAGYATPRCTIANEVSGAGQYDIALQFTNGSGVLYMGGTPAASWSGLPAADTWAHYLVVVDKTAVNRARLYLNGTLHTAETDISARSWYGGTTPQNLQVGRYAGGQYVDGQLRGMSIFHRALTAQEARWLYEEGARDMAFNRGNADSPVVMRITGPITDPVIWNMTTNTLFTLTGTISAGNWWEIDTSDGTIVDQAGANQYGKMVFASSEWKDLKPGVNDLRLVGTGTTGATELKLTWKDAWI